MDPKDIAVVNVDDAQILKKAINEMRAREQAPIMNTLLTEEFHKEEVQNLLPRSLSEMIRQQMEMTINVPPPSDEVCWAAAPDSPKPMSSFKRKAARERKRIAKLHRKQGRH